MNLKPSKEYPYGIEKIKNMVVMIPAVLFLVFGVETLYMAFLELWQGHGAVEETSNEIWSLLVNFIIKELALCSFNWGRTDCYWVQSCGCIQGLVKRWSG